MPGSLNAGDLLAGKYRIERMLGRGGMGEVYLAENTALGRRVAIKVVRNDAGDDGPGSELLARFRGEARAAAAIGHPGIIDVLDLGSTDEGVDFIVMEYLDGESLRDRLDRVCRLGVADVARIGGDMLEALAAAHDAGVVHRDLKPDNIFLVARPVAVTKILDFGISKLTHAGDASLTSTGRIMGTPQYMSPEQGRGARVGSPTDVYSAGALLYRALSGETPVAGTSINEVISNLATVPPVPLAVQCPDLPRALTDLVDRMLARLPEMRPSAREAALALRAAASGLGPVAGAVAATAPRMGDATGDVAGHTPIRARAPQGAPTGARGGAPGVGLESTLGATASELGLLPTDPASATTRGRGTSTFLKLAVGLAAVSVAATVFLLVRPHGSRTRAAAPPFDAAPAATVVDAADPTPIDAATLAPPPEIDAGAQPSPTDAAVAPPLDAPKAPRRKVDAGDTTPNLEDVKDHSPFRRDAGG
ncbi:MAG TPA: serine/threonine-protein kinase [Kofleriaceae bacterium]|nr:serine/threonine-protein kinase [Kofleriaceae bacterium]